MRDSEILRLSEPEAGGMGPRPVAGGTVMELMDGSAEEIAMAVFVGVQ